MTDTLPLVVAQTWQLTLVAVAALLLVRLFARKRPYLATALWLVVLVKAVTPPVWSSPVGLFSRLVPQEASVAEPPPPTASAPAFATPSRHASELASDVLLGHVPDDTPIVGHTSGVPIVPPLPAAPDVANDPETKPKQSDVPEVSLAAHEDAARQRRAPQPSATEQSPATSTVSSTWRLVDGLGVVWIAGVLCLVIRATRGWCRIRAVLRDVVEPDAALVAMFETTRRRLRVRTPVRLVVTRRAIGPAVVGLVRPTIVLPAVVVRGRSPRDIEPILVHELLHVRRGDLWIGALQLLVAGLWWFHPLVWWVNRSLTRDVERCCDAESVAALGRPPAEYARSLVAVLELKRDLEAVPAFPGVRPLDVTANRLERIMRTKTPPNRWTRWGTRLALVALAAIVLPGAADDPEPETADLAAEPANGDDSAETKATERIPTAIDVQVPVVGPNGEADERIFSFFVGTQEVDLFSEGDATVDNAASDAEVITEPVVSEPTVTDLAPGETVVSTTLDEPALVREMGDVELRIYGDVKNVSQLMGSPADLSGPTECVEEIVGPAIEFEGVLRGKPVVRGRTETIRLRRILDGTGPEGRPVSIECDDTTTFRLVGELESLHLRGGAKKLHVDLHARVEGKRRVLVLARDGVELQSPDARLTAKGVAVYLDPTTERPNWRLDRVLMQENIGIAIRSGDQWRTVRAEKLEMDGEGRIKTSNLATFHMETIEEGELVTRSTWPVPFEHREPLDRVEAPEPATRPTEPLSPPETEARLPESVERDVVTDLLLGTAPATKPPTVLEAIALWQETLPIEPPLHVEFTRHRYDHAKQELSQSRGSYRLEAFAQQHEDASGEESTSPFASTYQLTGPEEAWQFNPGVRPVKAGYRVVPEPPIEIRIVGLELRVSRPGPDLQRTLTSAEMSSVYSLRMLQVGCLTELVRDACDWRLDVDGLRWTLHGRPRPGHPVVAQAKSVEILLDAETGRPIATKLVLKDGGETVHSNLKYDAPEPAGRSLPPAYGRPASRPSASPTFPGVPKGGHDVEEEGGTTEE